MLRGAISGFGAVAERAHLAGWQAHPELALVALHEPVAARRHTALRILPNIRIYDDLELMLAGERLDFIDIASPPAHHAPTALAALNAGVNVLVEKPLALEADGFDALAMAAAEAGRVLMCVHNWKYAPAYQRAHELIAQGRLGRLEYLSLHRVRARPAGELQAAAGGERWRREAASGGGILIDHGWHIFYLAQFLFGGARPRGITARLGRPPGSLVEDFAELRIDFDEGVAQSHLSWRGPVRRTTALMYGSKGMLEIDGNRLRHYSPDETVRDDSVADAADDSYHPSWFAGVVEEFIGAVKRGPSSVAARRNLDEARSAIRLMLAARESDAKAGSYVSLG